MLLLQHDVQQVGPKHHRRPLRIERNVKSQLEVQSDSVSGVINLSAERLNAAALAAAVPFVLTIVYSTLHFL